jgi:hypothetical protein
MTPNERGRPVGTDLERQPSTGELVELSPEEQALADEIKGDISDADLVIPQLKLAQGQSDMVQSGDAEPGDFVLPLTGENFGTEIEFVVVDTYKGHFWRDEENDTARGTQGPETVVPWQEHPCYGQPFAECPDAEAKFKADVNAGEHEWGDGPPISETENFIGFVVGPDGGSETPVRLSLMRKAKPAAYKLLTYIKRMSRTPWERAYALSSVKQTKGRYTFHVPEVSRGREATVAERQAAVDLATSIRRQGLKVETPEEPEAAPAAEPEPVRDGALDV